MAARIDRRQLLQLSAVVVGGWGAGRLLLRLAPIGRDVGRSTAVRAILGGAESPAAGPPDASLRLAMFTDYYCPACRHAFPALAEAVADDGDIRLIYKDWPIFGARSERAARVALACVGQGVYPAVHHRLMTGNLVRDDAMLRVAVTEAGADWARAIADLAARAPTIAARLRRNGTEAQAIGLAGTPGFLAGSTLVTGAIDRNDFARLFAQARQAR